MSSRGEFRMDYPRGGTFPPSPFRLSSHSPPLIYNTTAKSIKWRRMLFLSSSALYYTAAKCTEGGQQPREKREPCVAEARHWRKGEKCPGGGGVASLCGVATQPIREDVAS